MMKFVRWLLISLGFFILLINIQDYFMYYSRSEKNAEETAVNRFLKLCDEKKSQCHQFNGPVRGNIIGDESAYRFVWHNSKTGEYINITVSYLPYSVDISGTGVNRVYHTGINGLIN